MKTLRSIFAALAISFAPLASLVVISAGCSAVAPGSDAVVVRAQQTINSSWAGVDTFLRIEASNRTLAQELDPGITRTADALRRTYPDAHRSAWAVLDSYKANRTPDNKANLATALKVLSTALERAQANLAKLYTSTQPLQ